MEHMSYAKSISWIDDCRIPFVDEVGIKISGDKKHLQKWKEKDGRTQRNIDEIENTPYMNTQGRFPANLLVCDDMLNDGLQYKSGFNPNAEIKQYNGGKFGGGKTNENNGYGDKGTNSRYYDIDKWFNNLLESCG